MRKIELDKTKLKYLYVEKRKTIDKIARILGVGQTTIYRRLLEYGIPIRPLSESFTKYTKNPFSEKLPEKSYLLGFRAGDLHARWKGYSVEVSCASTHMAQINLIRYLFEKYGKVSTYKRKDNKTIQIYSLLHPTFEFLVEKPKFINKDILNNRKLFFHFLCGYSDAEGYWDTKRGRFRVATYDKHILKRIYSKLMDLGIISSFHINNNKRLKQRKVTYEVCVGKRYVRKLAKNMFSLSRHEEKLSKMKTILDGDYI